MLVLLLVAGSIAIWGCKKKEDPPPDPTPTTTVTDVDGNVYNIIEIGTQKWLKENLRTTKYRDGSPITHASSDIDWGNLTGGGWCNYENDAANDAVYGKLYNYSAITDSKNICPTGWHVPTLTEWNTLITFLGDTAIAGGKLKEVGTAHWTSPNTGATNTSGFTALPGGQRFHSGAFYQKNSNAFFWTSTYSMYTCLSHITTEIYTYTSTTKLGFSVRCIKD